MNILAHVKLLDASDLKGAEIVSLFIQRPLSVGTLVQFQIWLMTY